MSTVHGDAFIFVIISHSVLVKMRNTSQEICREIKTHILYSILFFPKILSLIR